MSSTSSGCGDGQVLGRRVAGEEVRRHHVHPLVGALRRQDRGGEQLVGVAVVERAEVARRPRVLAAEALEGAAGPPRRGARASLLRGGSDVGHRGARVSTGTVAPMRHLEIAGEVGSAHVDRIPTGWSIDVDGAADDGHASDAPAGALDAVADRGRRAGPAVGAQRRPEPWRRRPTALGFREERSLHQLRRPLPVDEPWSLEVRPFVVGQDEDGVARGEQPGLRLAPRAGRLDARGPRGAVGRAVVRPRRASCSTSSDGRLVGFCWTKEHRDERPAARARST